MLIILYSSLSPAAQLAPALPAWMPSAVPTRQQETEEACGVLLSCYSGAAPGGYSSAPTTWNHAEGRAYQLTWRGCSALSMPSLPPSTPCALHCQGRERPLWSWTDGSVTILGTVPLSGSWICASQHPYCPVGIRGQKRRARSKLTSPIQIIPQTLSVTEQEADL